MELIKLAHHRNGITAAPFSVGLVKDEDSVKLIVQFDDSLNYTAVFDLELLKKEIIEFHKNSWRGDHYSDEFAKMVKVSA